MNNSRSEKTFIAFSGGVESTTMALLFGREAQCVFTDTGAEHKKMYERIEKVETTLKAIHGDGFSVLKIKPSIVAGKPIDNLTDYIRHAGVFPNQVMRFCTKYFKIQPMNRFLADHKPCSLMIGLNADEIETREGNHGIEGVSIEYPLADLGLTRARCLELLNKEGICRHGAFGSGGDGIHCWIGGIDQLGWKHPKKQLVGRIGCARRLSIFDGNRKTAIPFPS